MPSSSELHTAFLAVARDAEQMAKSMREFASLYASAEEDHSPAETNDADGSKKRKRRTPKIVDPRQPEKAQSAYNHFIKENYLRARTEETDNRGVMAVLGKEWKEISDEDKKRYQAMAAKDKERFDREMKEFAAYRKEHPYDAATEGTTVSSKKQKKKLANASQTSSPAQNENEDELDKSSDDEEEQPDKEKTDAAKAPKKKADKKEKKAKAGNDKNEQAKDGKKKRRNSKTKKPVTKGQ